MIRSLENYSKDISEEVWDSLNKTALLLTAVGRGSFDLNTKSWKPTSTKVYSFDMEVFDISLTYTLFLQGISAISGEAFEITQLVEDVSNVNYEEGNGIQKISFCLNGKPYLYEATVDNDWFDTNIIYFMNQIFLQEDFDKRLYCMSDG